MVRLRTIFCGTAVLVVMFSHQVSALSLGLHLFGLSSGYAIHSAASCQILLVYLHSESKWCADSMTPLQRGHEGECGHPLLASLSEVHTRFWVMSQMKDLHFGGA